MPGADFWPQLLSASLALAVAKQHHDPKDAAAVFVSKLSEKRELDPVDLLPDVASILLGV